MFDEHSRVMSSPSFTVLLNSPPKSSFEMQPTKPVEEDNNEIAKI